jgi:GxxExxY protein
LAENKIIIKLKSIDAIHPIYEAQILTYMKFAGIKTGLLINFNATKLKEGLKRFVF